MSVALRQLNLPIVIYKCLQILQIPYIDAPSIDGVMRVFTVDSLKISLKDMDVYMLGPFIGPVVDFQNQWLN